MPASLGSRPVSYSGRASSTLDVGSMNLELWQRAAVALDDWACNGTKGRDKRDPIYQHVVEGRDGKLIPYERYSSCGDRAHWKLWRLGVRLPFVNREERSPLPGDWKPGMNISELHWRSHGAPCEPGRPGAGWVPEPGDELLIWNHPSGFDAHSLSVMAYDPSKREALTANYGAAGMSKATFPGAVCKPVPFFYSPTEGWMCGKRKVQRVTKLAKVVPLITAKPNFRDLDGKYIFGDGETIDELESIVP